MQYLSFVRDRRSHIKALSITPTLWIALFFFCILTQNAFGLGIGEWNAQTPGGNQIRHDRNSRVTSFSFVVGQPQLDSLTRWYFYKNHIVGTISNGKYFVVDEINLSVKKFENQAAWEIYLDTYKLSPPVWTRWCDDDWTFSEKDFSGYLYLELLLGIAISVSMVFLNHIKMAASRKKTRFKRSILITMTIFIILPITLTAVYYFMRIHPESI